MIENVERRKTRPNAIPTAGKGRRGQKAQHAYQAENSRGQHIDISTQSTRV